MEEEEGKMGDGKVNQKVKNKRFGNSGRKKT